jgi:hypothetical protein
MLYVLYVLYVLYSYPGCQKRTRSPSYICVVRKYIQYKCVYCGDTHTFIGGVEWSEPVPTDLSYIHIHTYTYTHTYIHTQIHTHIHTYIHTYTNTYTHTYIHTYTHTHTHTHTYLLRLYTYRSVS